MPLTEADVAARSRDVARMQQRQKSALSSLLYFNIDEHEFIDALEDMFEQGWNMSAREHQAYVDLPARIGRLLDEAERTRRDVNDARFSSSPERAHRNLDEALRRLDTMVADLRTAHTSILR